MVERMCGRYASTRSATDLAALFDAVDLGGDERLGPDYNIAPTDPVHVVRISESTGGRVVSVARWGLVPVWSRDDRPSGKMINARAETVATNGAFRDAFARRRCLVPADGWYEWLRTDDGKQAYFMTLRDGGVLAFAGLWSPAGSLSCGVVTTAAVGGLAAVHDRMPLVLPEARWDEWLTGRAGQELLVPTPPDLVAEVEIRPVGPAVGDVRNDGPELIRRHVSVKSPTLF